MANPALGATLWGHSADPDADGISNLLEHALNTNPLSSSTTGLPVAGIGLNGALTLTFFRASADITYVVEGSSNLANPSGWTVIPYVSGPVGSYDTVTDNVTTKPRFLRLRVTMP